MMPTDPNHQSPMPPWQATQTMQLPLQPPAEEPAGKRRRWLRWVIPLVAFLFGIGVGGAGARDGGGAPPPALRPYEEPGGREEGGAGARDEAVAAGLERAVSGKSVYSGGRRVHQ